MHIILSVELEVRCSQLSKPAGTRVDSGREFATALYSLDTSDTSIVTLVMDDTDIASIALTIFGQEIQRFPALRVVTVRFASEIASEVADALCELYKICRARSCDFYTDILLGEDTDGFALLAEKSDKRCNKIYIGQLLLRSGVTVRWLIPAIEPLVFRLEGIVSLARELGIDPLLVPPEIVPVPGYQLRDLSSEARLFLWDFITYRFLGSDSHLLKPGQKTFYTSLVTYIEQPAGLSEPATVSVLSKTDSVGWRQSIESIPDAKMRSTILAADNNVTDSVSSVHRAIELSKDVSDVLLFGGRAHLLRAMVRADRSRASERLSGDFEKVLLIGAYGGEHIGDAAILGGVLYRMHERFGTREAVLMTQRPNHTRHLLPMLDVPVNVTVESYERPQIQSHVDAADCVVFAGGPLIDLPKQLVRHLYTVSLARKAGKPFIAEGIGPGPFVRLPSKFTARRLLELADRISLRAGDAADHEVVQGLNVEVGLCPAFDYLKTRGAELSRLPEADSASIAALLEGTEGRPVVGINIRPINHLYTVGATETDVAAYTRKIEERFEQRFAEGLREYSRKSTRSPCFVFFPMNAIQFGSSDLLSAYRIRRLLEPEVDFRVWEADASLDGVIALLRKLDIAITMRFHATIFALSQNCQAIGIDYRIGKRDKIAGLMEDVGQIDNCSRIDLLTGEWLANKLVELVKP